MNPIRVLCCALFLGAAFACDADKGACRQNKGGDQCCTDQDRGDDHGYYCDDGHSSEYVGGDCARIIFGIPTGKTYSCCKDDEGAAIAIIIVICVVAALIACAIIGGICLCHRYRCGCFSKPAGIAPATQVGVPMQPVQQASVIQGGTMPAQPAVQSQPQQQSTVAQLKELKELLDAGALTQDEFDSQKTAVLAGTK
jgi:hypothetical protein